MTDRLTPYPAYKDSGAYWLGRVPAHWELQPTFTVLREKQVRNTGLAVSDVLSLSYGRIIKRDIERNFGLLPASFETYQIVEPGNLIMRLTDLQNDQRSLRVGLANDRGIITSAYLCLQPSGDVVPSYLYYLFHALDVQKVFYGMGSGLRQSLGFDDLKRLSIAIPPASEQQSISRYLDHADRRINRYIRAKRRLIELLNEQKQAIIHQAVTRGLDPNVRLKPSGVAWLGDIPEHWTVWKVAHFARIGNGSTPARSNSSYWTDGSYPWLTSSAVHQERITTAEQFVTDLALRECHLPKVPPQSVLVAITGQGKTRGTAALLEFEATINQHIAYITPYRELVTAEYLQAFLAGSYRQLRSMSDDSGSTRGALTCEDLKYLKVPAPPPAEQAAIVDEIRSASHSIDAARVRANREIDLIREYRTRLIADVVTGKLDVRGVELPELEETEPLDDLDLARIIHERPGRAARSSQSG